MKLSNKIIISFAALIVIAVLYRFIPLPKGVYGFTPMFAMAIFGGVIFKDNKKLAFALPLITFFFSDIIYQLLYNAGKPFNGNWGFYKDQWLNYILFAITVCIGFFIKKINIVNVTLAAIAAPTLFYILSNFSYWAFTQSYYNEHKTLLQCYIDGLPFYLPWSVVSTIVYSGILFGAFYGVQNFTAKKMAVSH
ncbi:hypothetical protein A9P82_06910 [Arachidicoccus ginsenosidimutans]|uniref:DUF6580 family putative transport protein n=1 Tax=Arachidicoccus sp. BS20 TaxID=1850526 RepID=UPI0007F16A1D|nr:DUF6580 family putative transport protein [Arachidicoccus sp. BS20]ANI89045.1 hypothetical protein A9P82_06910 [Arachidicoccus sp. BS20]